MPGARAQVAQVSLRLWASFLNNSSSRWEAAWEAWPLRLELVDRVSAVYRSDHQRRARLLTNDGMSALLWAAAGRCGPALRPSCREYIENAASLLLCMRLLGRK